MTHRASLVHEVVFIATAIVEIANVTTVSIASIPTATNPPTQTSAVTSPIITSTTQPSIAGFRITLTGNVTSAAISPNSSYPLTYGANYYVACETNFIQVGATFEFGFVITQGGNWSITNHSEMSRFGAGALTAPPYPPNNLANYSASITFTANESIHHREIACRISGVSGALMRAFKVHLSVQTPTLVLVIKDDNDTVVIGSSSRSEGVLVWGRNYTAQCHVNAAFETDVQFSWEPTQFPRKTPRLSSSSGSYTYTSRSVFTASRFNHTKTVKCTLWHDTIHELNASQTLLMKVFYGPLDTEIRGNYSSDNTTDQDTYLPLLRGQTYQVTCSSKLYSAAEVIFGFLASHLQDVSTVKTTDLTNIRTTIIRRTNTTSGGLGDEFVASLMFTADEIVHYRTIACVIKNSNVTTFVDAQRIRFYLKDLSVKLDVTINITDSNNNSVNEGYLKAGYNYTAVCGLRSILSSGISMEWRRPSASANLKTRMLSYTDYMYSIEVPLEWPKGQTEITLECFASHNMSGLNWTHTDVFNIFFGPTELALTGNLTDVHSRGEMYTLKHGQIYSLSCSSDVLNPSGSVELGFVTCLQLDQCIANATEAGSYGSGELTLEQSPTGANGVNYTATLTLTADASIHQKEIACYVRNTDVREFAVTTNVSVCLDIGDPKLMITLEDAKATIFSAEANNKTAEKVHVVEGQTYTIKCLLTTVIRNGVEITWNSTLVNLPNVSSTTLNRGGILHLNWFSFKASRDNPTSLSRCNTGHRFLHALNMSINVTMDVFYGPVNLFLFVNNATHHRRSINMEINATMSLGCKTDSVRRNASVTWISPSNVFVPTNEIMSFSRGNGTDDTVVHSRNTYTISRLHHTHNITCTVKNVDSNVTAAKTLILNVIQGPSRLQVEGSISNTTVQSNVSYAIRYGERHSLRCTTDNTFPGAQVEFGFYTGPGANRRIANASDMQHFGGGSLKIMNETDPGTGFVNYTANVSFVADLSIHNTTISCRAVNVENQETLAVDFSVYISAENVEITISITNENGLDNYKEPNPVGSVATPLIAGKNYTAKCSFTSEVALGVIISWDHSPNPPPPVKKNVLSSGNYKYLSETAFTASKMFDGTTFRCKASHGKIRDFDAEQSVTVYVYYGPTAMSLYVNNTLFHAGWIDVTAGTPLDIRCLTDDVKPDGGAEWSSLYGATFSPVVQKLSGNITGTKVIDTSVVIISSVKSHADVYSCEAHNLAEKNILFFTRSLRVNVKFGPSHMNVTINGNEVTDSAYNFTHNRFVLVEFVTDEAYPNVTMETQSPGLTANISFREREGRRSKYFVASFGFVPQPSHNTHSLICNASNVETPTVVFVKSITMNVIAGPSTLTIRSTGGIVNGSSTFLVEFQRIYEVTCESDSVNPYPEMTFTLQRKRMRNVTKNSHAYNYRLSTDPLLMQRYAVNMTFTATTNVHGMPLSCNARNIQSEELSAYTSVEVTLAVSKVNITVTIYNATNGSEVYKYINDTIVAQRDLFSNEEYKFECSAPSIFPNVSVIWTPSNITSLPVTTSTGSNPTIFASNFTLNVSSVHNKAMVNCTVQHGDIPELQSIHSILLNVLFGPTTLTIESNVDGVVPEDQSSYFVKFGKMYNLTCSTDTVYKNASLKFAFEITVGGISAVATKAQMSQFGQGVLREAELASNPPDLSYKAGMGFTADFTTHRMVAICLAVNDDLPRFKVKRSVSILLDVQRADIVVTIVDTDGTAIYNISNQQSMKSALVTGKRYNVQCEVISVLPSGVDIAWNPISQSQLNTTQSALPGGAYSYYSNFSFTASKDHHKRQYTCSVAHSVVSEINSTRQFELDVHYGPDSLNISVSNGTLDWSNNQLSVRYMKNYTIFCQTELYPSASVLLRIILSDLTEIETDDAVVLTSSSYGKIIVANVTFQATFASHNSKVTCTITNRATRASSSQEIKILMSEKMPDLSVIVQSVATGIIHYNHSSETLKHYEDLTEGVSYYVECKTVGTLPNIQLKWTRPTFSNQEVSNDTRSGQMYTSIRSFTFIAKDIHHQQYIGCQTKQMNLEYLQQEAVFKIHALYGPSTTEIRVNSTTGTSLGYGLEYGRVYVASCKSSSVSRTANVSFGFETAPSKIATDASELAVFGEAALLLQTNESGTNNGLKFLSKITFTADASVHKRTLRCFAENNIISRFNASSSVVVYIDTKETDLLISVFEIGSKSPTPPDQRSKIVLVDGWSYTAVCQTDNVIPNITIHWVTSPGMKVTPVNGTNRYQATVNVTANSSLKDTAMECSANHSVILTLASSKTIGLDVYFGPSEVTLRVDGASLNRSQSTLVLHYRQIYTITCWTDGAHPQPEIVLTLTRRDSPNNTATTVLKGPASGKGHLFYTTNLAVSANLNVHRQQLQCVAKNTEVASFVTSSQVETALRASKAEINIKVKRCKPSCSTIEQNVIGHLSVPLTSSIDYVIECSIETVFETCEVDMEPYSPDGPVVTHNIGQSSKVKRSVQHRFTASAANNQKQVTCIVSHPIVTEVDSNRTINLTVWFGPTTLSINTNKGRVNNQGVFYLRYSDSYQLTCFTDSISTGANFTFGFLVGQSVNSSSHVQSQFGSATVSPVSAAPQSDGGKVYSRSLDFQAALSVHDQDIFCSSENVNLSSLFSKQKTIRTRISATPAKLTITVQDSDHNTIYNISDGGQSVHLINGEVYCIACDTVSDLPAVNITWGVQLGSLPRQVNVSLSSRNHRFSSSFLLNATSSANLVSLECMASHRVVQTLNSNIVVIMHVFFGSTTLEVTRVSTNEQISAGRYGLQVEEDYEIKCATDNVYRDALLSFNIQGSHLLPEHYRFSGVLHQVARHGSRKIYRTLTFKAVTNFHDSSLSCQATNVNVSRFNYTFRTTFFIRTSNATQDGIIMSISVFNNQWQPHESDISGRLSNPLTDGRKYRFDCKRTLPFEVEVSITAGTFLKMKDMRGFDTGQEYHREFSFTASKEQNNQTVACNVSHPHVTDVNTVRSVTLVVYFGPEQLFIERNSQLINASSGLDLVYGRSEDLTCTTDSVYQNVTMEFGFLLPDGNRIANTQAEMKAFGKGSLEPLKFRSGICSGQEYIAKLRFLADSSVHRQTIKCYSLNVADPALQEEEYIDVRIQVPSVKMEISIVSVTGFHHYVRSDSDNIANPLERGVNYTVTCTARTLIPAMNMTWDLRVENWEKALIASYDMKETPDAGEVEYFRNFTFTAIEPVNDQHLTCRLLHSVITEIDARQTVKPEVLFGPTRLVVEQNGIVIPESSTRLQVTYNKGYVLSCKTDNVNNNVTLNLEYGFSAQGGAIRNAHTLGLHGGNRFSSSLHFVAKVYVHGHSVRCRSQNIDLPRLKQERDFRLYLAEGKKAKIEIVVTNTASVVKTFVSTRIKHNEPIPVGTRCKIECSTTTVLPDIKVQWNQTFVPTKNKHDPRTGVYTNYFEITITKEHNNILLVCSVHHQHIPEVASSLPVRLKVLYGPSTVTMSLNKAGARLDRDSKTIFMRNGINYTVTCLTDDVSQVAVWNVHGLTTLRGQFQNEFSRAPDKNGGRVFGIHLNFNADGLHDNQVSCSAFNSLHSSFTATTETFRLHVSKGPTHLRFSVTGPFYQVDNYFIAVQRGWTYSISCTTDATLNLANMSLQVNHTEAVGMTGTLDYHFTMTVPNVKANPAMNGTQIVCKAFNVHERFFEIIRTIPLYVVGEPLDIQFSIDGVDQPFKQRTFSFITKPLVRNLTCWVASVLKDVSIWHVANLGTFATVSLTTRLDQYPWFIHYSTMPFIAKDYHNNRVHGCEVSHPMLERSKRMISLVVFHGPLRLAIETPQLGQQFIQSDDSMVVHLLNDVTYRINCVTDGVHEKASMHFTLSNHSTSSNVMETKEYYKIFVAQLAVHTYPELNDTDIACFAQNADVPSKQVRLKKHVIVEIGWSPWVSAQCSVTCGAGTYKRTRTCLRPDDVDTYCQGLDVDFKSCRFELSCEKVKYMKDATFMRGRLIGEDSTLLTVLAVLVVCISGLTLYMWYERHVYLIHHAEHEEMCRQDFEDVINLITKIVAHSELFDELEEEPKLELCKQLVDDKINEIYSLQVEQEGAETEFDVSIIFREFKKIAAEIIADLITRDLRKQRRRATVLASALPWHFMGFGSAKLYREDLQNKYDITFQLLETSLSSSNNEEIKKYLDKYIEFCKAHNDTFCVDKTLVKTAQKRILMLTIKPHLIDAERSGDLERLQRVVDMVEQAGLADTLHCELAEARNRCEALINLESSKRAVINIDRRVIHEIKKFYVHPPRAVHDVLIATFLILGDQEVELQDWNHCVSLCGTLTSRNYVGLYKRFVDFKLTDFSLATASRATAILSSYSEKEIETTSKSASIFYRWTLQACAERLEMGKQDIDRTKIKTRQAKRQGKFDRRVTASKKSRRHKLKRDSPNDTKLQVTVTQDENVMLVEREQEVCLSPLPPHENDGKQPGSPQKGLEAKSSLDLEPSLQKKATDHCLIESKKWEKPKSKFVFPYPLDFD